MSIFDERYERIAQIRKRADTADKGNANAGQSTNAGQSGGITSPFDGYRVTSRPGARSAPTAGASTNHKGLDRAMPKGTALSLPIDVTYYRSGSDNARGKWIEFKDNSGNILHYQHLDSYGIFKPGERVAAGSQIAVSGNSGIGTGAHLHEEYYTPDGQNITESYWNGYANGAKSGAAPVEYKKAGGNIFNVGTNALARGGKSALSGAYDNLSRYEKVQMLKRRREERREERANVGQGRGAYDNFTEKYSKSAVEERAKDGQGAKGISSVFLTTPTARKNFQAALHKMNPIASAVEKQNEKAEEYRAGNEKTIENAAKRLNDESFVQRGVKYRKLAKEAAKEWGTENRTAKGVDLLLLGNKEWAEKHIGIKALPNI